MCRRHWFALRSHVRGAVLREYRPGQERDKKPSLRYLAVQQRAIGELAFKPHDEKAAHDSSSYLVRAEIARALCIAHGGGDPLEELTTNEPMPVEDARAMAARLFPAALRYG